MITITGTAIIGNIEIIATGIGTVYNVEFIKNGGEYTGGYLEVTTYEHGTELLLPTGSNISKIGYTFLGWTASDELYDEINNPYIDRISVSEIGNKAFYAVWKLSDPELTKTEYSGIYDGIEHDISVSASHALSESYSLSYVWYQSEILPDKLLSDTDNTLTLKNVADSATYICVVSITVGEETAEASINVDATITPLEVVIRWNTIDSADGDEYLAAYTYDGTQKGVYPYITNSISEEVVSLSVTENYATNASLEAYMTTAVELVGEAVVISNYKLPNSGLTKEFMINAADITNNGAFSDYVAEYDKEAHGINCDVDKIIVVNEQEITIEYSSDNDNWSNSATYTDFSNGPITIYWRVSAPNHNNLTGQNTITISKKEITVTADKKNSVVGHELVPLTYKHTPELCLDDQFSGELSTNANKDSIADYDIEQGTLALNNNYSIVFVGAKYVVSAKAIIIIDERVQTYNYDNNTHNFAILESDFTGFIVMYYVDGAYTEDVPVNVGTYNVKVTRAEDADAFAFDVEITGGLVINKTTPTITVDQTPIVKTYGDTWAIPVATSDFGTVDCNKTLAQMANVGSYTIVYSIAETDNHYGATKDVSVTINKQQVTRPQADTTIFVANGSALTYTIAADERYSVSGNTQSTVGNYTVVVTLNSSNYEWDNETTNNLEYAFVICEAELAHKFDNANTVNDIILSAENGFKPGISVEIEEKPTTDYAESNFVIASNDHSVLQAVNITLKDGGNVAEIDGSVTVRILIKEANREITDLKVIYIADDGTYQDMNATRDGDYLIFTTNHFSIYAIVAPKVAAGLPTWSIILIVILCVLIVAIVVLLTLFICRKDKSQDMKNFFMAMFKKDETGELEKKV